MNAEKLATGTDGETISTERANYQKRGGEAITKTRISLMPKIDMGDGYFPPETVKKHREYIKKTEQRITSDADEGKLAKSFENLCLQGIRTGAWLGHPDTNGVTASAANTCKYDDYRHRVDIFSTLYYKSEKDQKTYSPTIGMDVTISGDKNTIMEKLTRTSNDEKDVLPFGFSRLDYFTNGVSKKTHLLIPRYVIGISSYDVRDINQTVKFDKTRNMLNFGLKNAKNMENRFKVLSEIYAENQLYLAMEPAERDTPELKLAHNRLLVVKNKLEQALISSGKELIKSGFMKGISEGGNKMDMVRAIEERLLEEGQKYFEEEQADYIMRGGVANESHSDTYVQIMNCVKDLTKLAKSGKLEQYKGVEPRNHKIIL